jgi:hypothetical protein
MPTLLCTSKYRKAFGLPEVLPVADTFEGALGPWYANTLNVGPNRMLHYMSGPSLLSVFIRLKERTTAGQRFMTALEGLLVSLRVKDEYIERELGLLNGIQYGRASDRSKLGSMRDQAYSAKTFIARGDSVAELNLDASTVPCGPLGYASPRNVASELLDRMWRGSRAS